MGGIPWFVLADIQMGEGPPRSNVEGIYSSQSSHAPPPPPNAMLTTEARIQEYDLPAFVFSTLHVGGRGCYDGWEEYIPSTVGRVPFVITHLILRAATSKQ